MKRNSRLVKSNQFPISPPQNNNNNNNDDNNENQFTSQQINIIFVLKLFDLMHLMNIYQKKIFEIFCNSLYICHLHKTNTISYLNT